MGKHYFLSRPRRFGKSLFLDTCKELFEGNEPLFEGLAIHDGWDWSVRHPVLRLSFGSGHFREPDYLRGEVMDQLQILEEESAVVARHDAAPARCRHLIRTLHQRAGRPVAILVDEYDKPILDALDVPEVARGEPRLPARPLRGRQGLRRAHPVQLHHRGRVRVRRKKRGPKTKLGAQPIPYRTGRNLKDITLHVVGYDGRPSQTWAPIIDGTLRGPGHRVRSCCCRTRGLDRDQVNADWYNVLFIAGGAPWIKVYNSDRLIARCSGSRRHRC